MSTFSKNTGALLLQLPFANRPGTDLTAKLVLKDDRVKSAIIEAVIGRKAGEQYWPRPTEWLSNRSIKGPKFRL